MNITLTMLCYCRIANLKETDVSFSEDVQMSEISFVLPKKVAVMKTSITDTGLEPDFICCYVFHLLY